MQTSLAVSQWIEQNNIKGFLAEDEGEALFNFALDACHLGPCLEIGSYCGKSSLYIGSACAVKHSVLYAVDHHKGSEEHQLGEAYHDADLYDSLNECMNTLPHFMRNVRTAKLENSIIPVIATSKLLVSHWATPLSLVFVDGGHSHETALQDCVAWSEKVTIGGFIAIHDIFENPKDGGQGPYLGLQAILEKDGFVFYDKVNTMAIVKRVG